MQQIEWINHHGGLRWAAGRCDRSAEAIYGWAEASDFATPFVADPAHRSHVVATIDLDDRVEATAVSGVLRANGIVDTDSYRKLGRNQLRIALFPAIEPDDVVALTDVHRPRRERPELTSRPSIDAAERQRSEHDRESRMPKADLRSRSQCHVPESAATTGAMASTAGAWTTW